MFVVFQSFRLQPPDCFCNCFNTLPLSVADFRLLGLGFAIRRQARQTTRPNRVHFRCGLTVRVPMLPTPPHSDAVSVHYRTENVSLKRTCTSQTTNTHKRTFLPTLSAQVGKATWGNRSTWKYCHWSLSHSVLPSLVSPDCLQSGGRSPKKLTID